ncbi:hypothetical protein KIH86_07070 [Paenibacillus sp. HN-1]|uniref:hypothetical protein n=1 Tax=Paenibacillus TaxID=44249 RepID=UPI001CA914D8|nr:MULTISPECIES: hypothetical protein [Paenibacillus]MBY9080419.1 hypothetical protein [Paenibacillus sp. CGMCC 1.18879]MBY9083999.1 hypothetical protein [Paenibacillus sinensis]
MKRHRSLSAAALAVLTLALSACGGDKAAEAPSATISPAASAEASPSATAALAPEATTSTSPEASAAVSPSVVPSASAAAPSAEPSAAPGQSAPAESAPISGTGVYNGQIDSHSIEIETKDGPVAFELGEGLENVPDTLNEEDKIVFEYVDRAVPGDATLKQHVLTKLAKAK